ncbi:hypothetical protein [Streptomyces sp. AP-93]|uniref:hypothetical protein n=1 Tax=Streptomyces sp. AP-93 TaxID=2929048 RepID=UPI001FAFDC74|nr:hypothetical protein [Streptomyces sp. AP-93]MCJ0875268.1 hypothetical protein [Streptomyces sp. AP-93]
MIRPVTLPIPKIPDSYRRWNTRPRPDPTAWTACPPSSGHIADTSAEGLALF